MLLSSNRNSFTSLHFDKSPWPGMRCIVMSMLTLGEWQTFYYRSFFFLREKLRRRREDEKEKETEGRSKRRNRAKKFKTMKAKNGREKRCGKKERGGGGVERDRKRESENVSIYYHIKT